MCFIRESSRTEADRCLTSREREQLCFDPALLPCNFHQAPLYRGVWPGIERIGWGEGGGRVGSGWREGGGELIGAGPRRACASLFPW